MIDALLIEQGSGGNLVIRNNDLVTVSGYENMPYIGQFGGDTFWADGLLLVDDQMHTCQTEKVMNSVPLNSSGRVSISNAVEEDLAFLADAVPGTATTVSVAIAAKNRIDSNVGIAGQNIYMQFNPDSSFLTYTLK